MGSSMRLCASRTKRSNAIAPIPSVTGIPLYHTSHSLIGRSTLLRPSKYRGTTSPTPKRKIVIPRKKSSPPYIRVGVVVGRKVLPSRAELFRDKSCLFIVRHASFLRVDGGNRLSASQTDEENARSIRLRQSELAPIFGKQIAEDK